MDGEVGIEPDLLSVVAQQPCANGVESASPGQRISHDVGPLPDDAPCNPFHPSRHFYGGTAREGHEQNPSRVGAIDEEMGDAMCQGAGLARTCARDDEEGRPWGAVVLPDPMLDRTPLFRIKGV